jgi:hypothetical protein
MPGYYSEQITGEIGRGAYDHEGHGNEQFLRKRNIGPYPEAVGKAWTHIKTEAMQNHGMREGSEQEEWQKLGPLKEPIPANAKNRGATNRRGRRRDEGRGTDGNGEEKREPAE